MSTPRRQETREKLLNAAIEVFAEHGFQAASVEHICSRAHFTRGAFYSNFTSKEELFIALLRREYERKITRMRDRSTSVADRLSRRSEPPSLQRVTALVVQFLSASEQDAVWFRLEAELYLLAAREHILLPEFAEYTQAFRTQMGHEIAALIGAAGRRFTIPVTHAIAFFHSFYERAYKVTVLSGADAPEALGEVGRRIAELLLALTEEAPSETPATPEAHTE